MSFLSKLLKPFKEREDPAVRNGYDRLVQQARLPVFYENGRVADTVSGRFDMIVLHAFLLFHRLKDEDDAARAFGQDVFDTFIEDMDRSLREMGVGYQAVPKRMKKMGEAFYGRVSAYDSAVEQQDKTAITQAIERNIFPDHDRADVLSTMFASYMFANKAALSVIPLECLLNGEIPFENPQDFINE